MKQRWIRTESSIIRYIEGKETVTIGQYTLTRENALQILTNHSGTLTCTASEEAFFFIREENFLRIGHMVKIPYETYRRCLEED